MSENNPFRKQTQNSNRGQKSNRGRGNQNNNNFSNNSGQNNNNTSNNNANRNDPNTHYRGKNNNYRGNNYNNNAYKYFSKTFEFSKDTKRELIIKRMNYHCRDKGIKWYLKDEEKKEFPTVSISGPKHKVEEVIENLKWEWFGFQFYADNLDDVSHLQNISLEFDGDNYDNFDDLSNEEVEEDLSSLRYIPTNSNNNNSNKLNNSNNNYNFSDKNYNNNNNNQNDNKYYKIKKKMDNFEKASLLTVNTVTFSSVNTCEIPVKFLPHGLFRGITRKIYPEEIRKCLKYGERRFDYARMTITFEQTVVIFDCISKKVVTVYRKDYSSLTGLWKVSSSSDDIINKFNDIHLNDTNENESKMNNVNNEDKIYNQMGNIYYIKEIFEMDKKGAENGSKQPYLIFAEFSAEKKEILRVGFGFIENFESFSVEEQKIICFWTSFPYLQSNPLSHSGKIIFSIQSNEKLEILSDRILHLDNDDYLFNNDQDDVNNNDKNNENDQIKIRLTKEKHQTEVDINSEMRLSDFCYDLNSKKHTKDLTGIWWKGHSSIYAIKQITNQFFLGFTFSAHTEINNFTFTNFRSFFIGTISADSVVHIYRTSQPNQYYFSRGPSYYIRDRNYLISAASKEELIRVSIDNIGERSSSICRSAGDLIKEGIHFKYSNYDFRVDLGNFPRENYFSLFPKYETKLEKEINNFDQLTYLANPNLWKKLAYDTKGSIAEIEYVNRVHPNKNNETLFSYAIKSTNLKLIEYMIQQGVDYKDTIPNACKVFNFVSSAKLIDFVINLLISKYNKEKVREMIKEVDYKTKWTTLHFAVRSANFELINYLLTHFGDLLPVDQFAFAEDGSKITPLHLAIYYDDRITHLLINHYIQQKMHQFPPSFLPSPAPTPSSPLTSPSSPTSSHINNKKKTTGWRPKSLNNINISNNNNDSNWKVNQHIYNLDEKYIALKFDLILRAKERAIQVASNFLVNFGNGSVDYYTHLSHINSFYSKIPKLFHISNWENFHLFPNSFRVELNHNKYVGETFLILHTKSLLNREFKSIDKIYNDHSNYYNEGKKINLNDDYIESFVILNQTALTGLLFMQDGLIGRMQFPNYFPDNEMNFYDEKNIPNYFVIDYLFDDLCQSPEFQFKLIPVVFKGGEVYYVIVHEQSNFVFTCDTEKNNVYGKPFVPLLLKPQRNYFRIFDSAVPRSIVLLESLL